MRGARPRKGSDGREMHSYLARRLVYAILTFFGITIATFALIHVVPGDPISFFLGKTGPNHIPKAILDAIRHEHHLDEPLPLQYWYWLRGVVTLDFGRSIVDHRPVVQRIAEKLPNTFILNSIAFLLAAAIGVPVGLWSATRSGRRSERASAVGFYLLYSLPSFWVALLLMQWLAVRLEILPLFGMTSDDYLELSFGAQLLDRSRHFVLPVITLAYAQIAIFARFSKSSLIEVIRQDFITTARAKGATDRAVLWHHAFRNALIPLITLLGLTIPYLISGSVIVERIFQWDGIGLLYFDAILARDYPTVLALTVATAVMTLLASVVADLLYAVADPRIRFGEEPT
ncbi:MAG: binding-protein-dependent transport system inner rane component [Acidobacteria bacterium]|nr:binding-protein-dependent transport system inner rane component [Acidobacteriota bacterium]